MEQTPKPPHRPTGLPPSMRRPAASSHPAPPKPASQPTPQRATTPPPKPPKSKKSLTFAAICIGVVSILVVIVIGVMGLNKLAAEGAIKSGSDQYQAVFLSNNMVYFGKLSNINGDFVKMTDIYYLQVQQQQGDQKTQQQQQSQLSLAKLGNELHGPEDAMFINRKEIMFWENLKTDGKVVQAIKNYKSGQK